MLIVRTFKVQGVLSISTPASFTVVKFILFFWLFAFVVLPAVAQTIPSSISSWNQSPAVRHAGFEERIMLAGITRDFASFYVQAITQFASQPAQLAQQLDEEVIVLVKEGELTLTLNQKKTVLEPGSIVVVMPGDVYRLENKAAQPLTYYLVRYVSNEMPDLDLYRLAGGSFWVNEKETTFQENEQGGIRRLFDGGTVMCRRVDIHMTTLNPGRQDHPPHSHRAAELILQVSNNAQGSIDEVRHPVSEGDVVFLDSGTPHAIQNTSQKSCRYLRIQFE